MTFLGLSTIRIKIVEKFIPETPDTGGIGSCGSDQWVGFCDSECFVSLLLLHTNLSLLLGSLLHSIILSSEALSLKAPSIFAITRFLFLLKCSWRSIHNLVHLMTDHISALVNRSHYRDALDETTSILSQLGWNFILCWLDSPILYLSSSIIISSTPFTLKSALVWMVWLPRTQLKNG